MGVFGDAPGSQSRSAGGGSGAAVRLGGVDDMLKMLRELPKAVQGEVAHDAMKTGGQVIADEAANMAPWDEGDLAGSIMVKTKGYKESTVAVIGPQWLTIVKDDGRKKNPGAYAHLVEFGHAIVFDGTLRDLTGTYLGEVPPHPFMRPAFDASKHLALQAAAEVYRQAIREFATRAIDRKIGRVLETQGDAAATSDLGVAA